MSASEIAIRGGQPSITTPMPPPCDSPKVVTRKRWPNVLPIPGIVAQASCPPPDGLAAVSLWGQPASGLVALSGTLLAACEPEHLTPLNFPYGRGTGVGRFLGVGVILSVGVAVGVGVAVAVAVAVGVAIGVRVAVGVGVGVGPDCAQYLPPLS